MLLHWQAPLIKLTLPKLCLTICCEAGKDKILVYKPGQERPPNKAEHMD